MIHTTTQFFLFLQVTLYYQITNENFQISISRFLCQIME